MPFFFCLKTEPSHTIKRLFEGMPSIDYIIWQDICDPRLDLECPRRETVAGSWAQPFTPRPHL